MGRTPAGTAKTAAGPASDSPAEPSKPQAPTNTAVKAASAGGTLSATGVATPQWYTIHQAAHLLFRKPKTILNLLSKHQLPRRKIRGPGRLHRRIVILSRDTLERLQRLTW